MKSRQRAFAFVLVGWSWLSGSWSLAQPSQCIKAPFQRTFSVTANLVAGVPTELSAAYHLPAQGYEVEQLSLRATTSSADASTLVYVLAAGISVKVQGNRSDHQMYGWDGPNLPVSMPGIPATKSQALHVYADADTNIVGRVTVLASWSSPEETAITLVTPGCWSAPQ
jgi:hypothetical protein